MPGKLLLLLYTLLMTCLAQAQVVYQEDFGGYADGTTIGTGWLALGGTCTPGDSHWGVLNGKFRSFASDGISANCCSSAGKGDNSIQFDTIDISAYAAVQAGFDLTSMGNLESVGGINTLPDLSCDAEHDAVLAEYRIDGGTWTRFQTGGYSTGDISGTKRVATNFINGNSLDVRIWVKTTTNNPGSEDIYDIDNFLVEGVCVLGAVTITKTDPDCGNNNGSVTVTAIGPQLEYSFDGGNNFDGDYIQENLDEGEYIIVVRESQNPGCNITQAVNLKEPDPVLERINLISPDCGMMNGSIDIQANGIDLEYKIEDLTWQDGSAFNNLESGDYYYTVREKGNPDCVIENSVFLPSSVNFSIREPVVNNIPGCQTADGEITIQVSGSGNFEFSTDGENFEPVPQKTGLAAGRYLLAVRDIDNPACFDTMSYMLSSERPNITGIEGININCGPTGGTLRINAVGTDLQYSIDGGINFSGNNSFPNVTIGRYDIVVQDNQDATCADTLMNYHFKLQSMPSLDSVVAMAPGCDGSDGNIQLFVSGLSTAFYEYSIDSGTTYQRYNEFANGEIIYPVDSSGLYHIAIRNRTIPECPDTTRITISGSAAGPSFVINEEDPDCFMQNGIIEINSIQSNLEYSIDDGQNFTSNAVFNDLDTGIYMVAVREITMPECISWDSVQLDYLPLPVINDLQVSGGDCGDLQSSILIDASGLLLEYSVDGQNFDLSNEFFDIGSGQIEVGVRQQASPSCRVDTIVNINSTFAPRFNSIISQPAACSGGSGSIAVDFDPGLLWRLDQVPQQTKMVIIGNSGEFLLSLEDTATNCSFDTTIFVDSKGITINSFQITPSSCGQNNGQINVFAQGGDLEYSLNGNLYNNNPVFTSLMAREYRLYIRLSTDPSCNIDTLVTVPGSTPILDSIAIKAPTCTEPDGFVEIFAQGNDLEYAVGDDDFSRLNAFVITEGGLYNLTIREKDDHDCLLDTSFVVPGPFKIDSIKIRPPSCFGNADGSAEVFVKGNVQIRWSHDDNLNAFKLNDLNGGIYAYTLTDGQCFFQDSLIIEEPAAIDVECFPGSLVNSILYTVENAILPVDYFFYKENDTIINLDDFTPSIQYEDLDPGEYQLVAVDANGCSASCTFFLAENDCKINLDAEVIQPGCGSPGSIRLTGINDPMVSIDWNVDALDEMEFGEDLSPGIYNVVVKSFSCNDSLEIELIENGISEIISDQNTLGCEGNDPFVRVLEVPGSSENLTLLLNGSSIAINERIDLEPGAHVLYAEDWGCSISDTLEVTSLENGGRIVQDTTIFRGQQATITADVVPDSLGSTNYSWISNDGVLCRNCNSITVQPDFTTIYRFQIKSNSGCNLILDSRVFVDNRQPFYLPNAYTPDGDGVNDAFVLHDGKDLVETIDLLQVFNKLGQLVYSAENLPPDTAAPNFLSTFSQTLNQEVYLYFIDISFKANYKKRYQGDFIILK